MTRFFQATEKVLLTGEKVGGVIINLDHVVAVDRVDGVLRAIMSVSGMIITIKDPDSERAFLNALVRWWTLLDRFVNERVEDHPEDE